MSCAIYPRAYTPMMIEASISDRLDFRLNGAGPEYTANITPGEYYSPEDFLAEVESAMDTAVGGGTTFTVAYDYATGFVTITPSSGTVGFDGANPSGSRNIRRQLGWLTATASAAPASPLTAPRQQRNLWLPEEAVASDSYWYERHIEGRTVSLAGQSRRLKHGTQSRREVGFELIPEAKTVTVDNVGLTLNQAFDQIYDEAKCRMRWWPDREELGTYYDVVLLEPEESFIPKRMFPHPGLYEFRILMGLWVEYT